ncbi:hypothetical protein [Myroides odoratimimus]|uniref:hypothetical protein n=1 Tax=Myroides odoratimimus TaxID=76832 RepID=UPI002577A0FA|nr:hypothetical protein [Myroides odoratimimus]MDM1449751.1 hypothetical protein [Myroides odoratimimus]
MNYIKNIVKHFAVVLMLFLSIGAFAQVNKTAGTRITDVTTEKELNQAAILDLDSSTRGFYMPRMNTAQRDQLGEKLLEEMANGKENTGLSIYNTTTDCIEYWNAETSKWRSLCGSLPPAKLDFLDGCSNIDVDGSIQIPGVQGPAWQQGISLNGDQNFITIRVYVSQIGTYQISADSGNGYFFTADGQFQAEGNYTVVLKGMGAPKQGYDQGGTGKKGDQVKFTFNGVPSKKCPDGVEIKVVPADLRLEIVRTTYEAAGKYYVGKEASEDEGNTLTLQVDVKIPGTPTISAVNETLGIGFVKVVEFKQAGIQEVVLTPMSGKLLPNNNDDASYPLELDISVKEADKTTTINGAKAIIKIEGTEISFDPTKVDFGREPIYKDSPMNKNHVITVPVKVIASGKASLSLKNAEGVEFEAKDVVFNKLDNPNETQNVVFTPVLNDKKMPAEDTSDFTMSGVASRFTITGDKIIKFNLAQKPVSYTVDCAKIKSNRSTVPYNKEIGDTYHIIVPVDVDVAGEYEIVTENAADGLFFSSTVNGVKQVFPGTGPQQVILYPVNKNVVPANKGTYDVRIINTDGNAKTMCEAKFKVKVGNPDLNILYIGSDYEADFYVFDRYVLRGNKFGETGRILETGQLKVDKVILHYADRTERKVLQPNSYGHANGKAMRTDLANKISTGDYNFIFIDGISTFNYSMDKQVADALEQYLKDKKGIVLAASSLSRYDGGYRDRMRTMSAWGNDGKTYPEKYALLDLVVKLNNNIDFNTKYLRIADKNKDVLGFLAPNDRLKMITHYSYMPGYGIMWYFGMSSLDLTGGNFIALTTATQNAPEGSIVIHKDYDFIFAPVLESTQDRFMFDYIKVRNSPDYDIITRNGPDHNNYKKMYDAYMGNLIISIFSKLMNN